LAIFVFASLGAFMGAVTGWIVSVIPGIGTLVRIGFEQVFGILYPDLTAIGAMLGFIAGFFKLAMHRD